MRIPGLQAIYDAVLKKAQTFSPRTEQDNPARALIEGARFRQQVEAHLVDVRSGSAWRSMDVHRELLTKHRENTEALAEVDQDSLRMYIGLMSGMSYSHQARLTATISEMTRTLDVLEQVPARLQAAFETNEASTEHTDAEPTDPTTSDWP